MQSLKLTATWTILALRSDATRVVVVHDACVDATLTATEHAFVVHGPSFDSSGDCAMCNRPLTWKAGEDDE